MTEDMMSLRTFVEKTPDADLLREMIGFAAERLMELEVGAATGAGYGEKNPLRRAAGRLGLHCHRLRPGDAGSRERAMARGRRPDPPEGLQARRPHGRRGDRRARLHDLCMDASRNARTDLSMTGRQIVVLYPAFGAGLSARWP